MNSDEESNERGSSRAVPEEPKTKAKAMDKGRAKKETNSQRKRGRDEKHGKYVETRDKNQESDEEDDGFTRVASKPTKAESKKRRRRDDQTRKTERVE